MSWEMVCFSWEGSYNEWALLYRLVLPASCKFLGSIGFLTLFFFITVFVSFFWLFLFDDGDLVMAKHDFPFLCFLKWDG